MGEYEPNDSRNVTQKDGNTPGEPPRTGPREDAAREKAKRDESSPEERAQQPEDKSAAGKHMKQPQQKARQSQSQGAPDRGSREAGIAQAGKEQMIDEGDPNTQSPGPATDTRSSGPSREEQARSRAAPTGEMNNTIEDGPLQGDQPQGIDIKTGDPRPDYDQYETNQPQNMHHEREEDDAERRRQAASQDGPMGGFAAAPGEAPDAKERGYGGASERREERVEDEDPGKG